MATNETRPLAVVAEEMPARRGASIIPAVFSERLERREKRALGDVFGLRAFGVNLTRLDPGGETSLLHRHHAQDEFIFVLEGHPVLVTDAGEVTLGPGMCAGFAAGGVAHHLVNRTERDVVYLEIGDRASGDTIDYPEDDLRYTSGPEGGRFTHRDGTPY